MVAACTLLWWSIKKNNHDPMVGFLENLASISVSTLIQLSRALLVWSGPSTNTGDSISNLLWNSVQGHNYFVQNYFALFFLILFNGH